MYDIAIMNGHVIDPVNKISSRLNIGVQKGKIAAISCDPLSGDYEIDAGGKIVAPGFVDMHMHEDPFDETAGCFSLCISDSMLKMGVTTAVGGNCGIFTGLLDPVRYLEEVDRKGFPINIAMLSPHEVLRNAFGNFDKYKPVSESVISGMARILDDQLAQGCIGLSMGVEYIPGINGYELQQLMTISAKHQKITAIHMRDDAEMSIPSVWELINASAFAGAGLQISHLGSMCSFGQMERVLSIVDSCRSKGSDIGFDSYPYYAYCTFIGSTPFDDGFLEKHGLGDEGYSRLEIASGKHAGERCTKELFEEVRRREPKAFLTAHLLSEKDVDMAISHPAGIVASDGIYSNGQGHPRGSGTFPRLINEYVKKKHLMSLEDAVGKITYMPAGRYGLNKGTLSIGADADIVVFDYQAIKDEASFQEPLKEPQGMEYVLIGGNIAIEGGRIINDRLGRAIRKASS